MIYMINMPFMSVSHPALGGHIIAANLKASGMPVKSLYFNHDLAMMIGVFEYETYCNGKEISQYLTEWLFAGELWGDGAPDDAGLFEYAGLGGDGRRANRMREIKADIIPKFMRFCVETIASSGDAEIVAFSNLLHTLPSLALGRRIKDLRPELKVIYGGSAFHGEVGEEIFDRLEWIDAMSNSEADDTAPEAFRRLMRGEPLDGLQGMMQRDAASGKIYKTKGSFVAAEDFDNGVMTDFDDYFDYLDTSGARESIKEYSLLLPFEASRGCWWHDLGACTFCGLNGVSSSYRAKNPENVIAAIAFYREKYGVTCFGATDNNMPMTYFETFLPRLAEEFGPGGIHAHFCVKSNLGRDQIKRLAESGIDMPQPGIESLSDNLLSLMNKGVSAIQNIFFLKCAGQYGAYPHWHILLGMYGERQSDYDGMASLMRNLVHLTPPGRAAHSFVKCHRYSAYHRESERYFEEIAPAGFYRYIFPDSFNYGRLAYLFDVKWRTPHEEPVTYDGVIDAVDWWRRLWRAPKTPALYIEGSPDREMSLVDSRFERVVRVKMDQNEARVYDMMDDIVSVDELLDRASSFCERGAASRILDSFVGHGLAVRLDERCLGLALRSGYKEWSPDERTALMRN